MTTDMYGPILIGGPCAKCGLTQNIHRGLTCTSAKQAHEEEVKRITAPIVEAFKKTLEKKQ